MGERVPSVKSRIQTAKEIWKAGYTTRIRIDPIVPIEGWEQHYSKLMDEIFTNFRPERITLGSLRGLTSTIVNSRDKSWTVYLSERSNWGKKVDFNTRYQNYMFIVKQLRKQYRFKNVALCKETIEMWKKLSLDYTNIKCNCIP